MKNDELCDRMKLGLIVALLTLWQVSGHAEIILNNPILEWKLREKKLESLVADLSAINAELKALGAKADAMMDYVQSTGWLHDQILPDVVKDLEAKTTKSTAIKR